MKHLTDEIASILSPFISLSMRSASNLTGAHKPSMTSIVYVSSATRPFSDEDLVQLLDQSREKNERLGLTGMLLYKNGNFIQLLEGSEQNLRPVYQSILNDPRHHAILRLLEEEVVERRFPDWSMGFRNLREVDLNELPGYTEFLRESFMSPLFQSDPTRAQKLLLVFRRTNR